MQETESTGSDTSKFAAERKQHRNRLADFGNSLSKFRNLVLPGEFGRLLRRIRPYSLLGYGRLKGIYQGVRQMVDQGIPGDLVECGTARGGSAALMQLTCRARGQQRSLWIYDTFEGLPPPTKEDPDYSLARNWEGRCRGGLDEVTGLFDSLQIRENTHFVKGLFQDTLPDNTLREIAFLHLDGDWYESTKVCLEHLYDKVVPGGIVQIDDYGHWAGARKAFHEFIEPRGIPIRLKYLDYTGRQFVKPR